MIPSFSKNSRRDALRQRRILPRRSRRVTKPQKTILVVDDEAQVRNLTELMLAQFGFRTLTADNGWNAVKIFEKEADTIDLVLMDLSMPRLSGKDALRAMRKLRPQSKIILSSGYGEEDSSLDEAPNAFLQKPFTLEALVQTVNQVLDAAAPA
jgi:two-component system, cell cycle sensor histidine kinase and response regulator CckA